ncbi:monovalent cation/H+ antiporter complex subunit F [Ornithinimicrobium cerasi]|uniref:Multicomponent Na+:H+ antiporter subunit F n=1 Tax=Ornithinimicrobium cerasi TaxID=2248773 RepID=A0A285VQB8_9MICO|nr:monovalent cation/H+ antiporter complex subunit F [Ornithinimicrobium cerasi]SOC56259.1 multicomponent Na+:H+ antiporter subunit F [Ornithinimicrobium cerasi]
MIVVVAGTVGVLLVAAVLGLVRLYTARDDASVAAVSDLLYFCAVGIVVMGALAAGSSITFDVAAIASMIGILATIALSRILTRGRR